MKLTLIAIVCGLSLQAADSQPVFDAIFSNDTAALKKLVHDAESANVKDKGGTTALMYASAFGTYDAAEFLVKTGADLNAANGFGATALMWATTDAAKVKLLLDHKAKVNAQSQSGRTALLVAASQPGSDAVVNLLLAGGADAALADRDGTNFLLAASSCGNFKQVQLALERGLKPDSADSRGATALMNAAGFGDLDSVKLLIAKGANVNAVTADALGKVLHGPVKLGKFTPLLLAAAYGPPAVVQELLKAGAKVNATDVRGMTPLMLATATEHRDPETIRLLRAAGAEQSPQVEEWSAKYTSTGGAAILKAADGSAERALPLLRKTSTGFMAAGGCVACHAQPAATMALKVAMDHGYKVTQADVQEHMPLAKGFWSSMSDRLLLRHDPPGGLDTVDYNLFLLAAMSYRPDTMTSAMVMNVLEQQSPDGGWHGGGISRTPMEDSDITRAAMSLRGMQQFAWPGRKADIDARVERARGWLKRATPVYNEEFAMQLMGLKWAGDSTVPSLSGKLAGMQNADGGWSQNPRLGSDAYATGQTLYALHEAGMASTEPVYQRGVKFLRSTQEADGSWHVKSRAPKFQPYFESGFPHGEDQWISMMGTAWAAMACMM